MYDVAIIGTGPAGLAAALNLKIHDKDFIWIGSKALSDKIGKAERITNYPGLLDVTGEEMRTAFLKQIEELGISITELMVNAIMPMGDKFVLLAGTEFYEVRSIILATGVAMKNTLDKETEFLGRGVSYCATCDGPLYKGKKIAVICNNKRFEHEVKYLTEVAREVVYYPSYTEISVEADNLRIGASIPKGLQGYMRAEAVTMHNDEMELVDGVFILRDSISLDALLKDLEMKEGHIIVDRHMKTNIPGVFAAGDCTGRPYQYSKAVGEGNVAAHSVIEYLG